MRTSKWYYLLVAIVLLQTVWSLVGTTFTLFEAGVVVRLLYLFGGLLGVLLTPVFFVALYFDAGIVRESSSPWNPDRRLWVGGGILCSLLGYALVRNPSVEFVGIAYLLWRFRNPASAEPDADPRPGNPE